MFGYNVSFGHAFPVACQTGFVVRADGQGIYRAGPQALRPRPMNRMVLHLSRSAEAEVTAMSCDPR